MRVLHHLFSKPFELVCRLGLAYAGSHRDDLISLLLPHVADETVSMEIASLSALALGFIGVGSCNYEVTSSILQTLMEREDSDLNEKWARFMALGLALLFLGKAFNAGWALDLLYFLSLS